MKRLIYASLLALCALPALGQVNQPGGGGGGLVCTGTAPNQVCTVGTLAATGGVTAPNLNYYDKRPRATTSIVIPPVAGGASCLISVSGTTVPQPVVSACATGVATGPGTITHIHLTMGNATPLSMTQSTLTIACDGSSYAVPLGTFFMAMDNPKPFSTDQIAYELGQATPASMNRRLEINFTSGCTVTFNNGDPSNSVTLFGEVDYRMGANVSPASRQHWFAFSQPSIPVAQYTSISALPTLTDANGGEPESITEFASSSLNSFYLEAYSPAVNIDGSIAVTANGTEDGYGCGYYCINAVGGHSTSKWGEFYSSGVGGSPTLQTPLQTYDALLYRFFSTDQRENALFTNTLGVNLGNGQNGKPGANPTGTINMSSLVTGWSHDSLLFAPSTTFSPAAGAVSAGASITLSNPLSGATGCYTTDGTQPIGNNATGCTHGNTLASGSSFPIVASSTVLATTDKTGYVDAPVSSAVYTTTGAYTYNTFVTASSGASSVTTITSPSVTPSAGDFTFVVCQGASNSIASFTLTNSQSNTSASLTFVTSSTIGGTQGFYVVSPSTSATTYTCTSNVTSTFLDVFVYDYHHTGGTPSFNTGTDISSHTQCSTTTATCTSGTYTTGAAALVIYCGASNANLTWTAGTIDGYAATVRGTATAIGNACEDLNLGTAVTGAANTMTINQVRAWNIVGAAFK